MTTDQSNDLLHVLNALLKEGERDRGAGHRRTTEKEKKYQPGQLKADDYPRMPETVYSILNSGVIQDIRLWYQCNTPHIQHCESTHLLINTYFPKTSKISAHRF